MSMSLSEIFHYLQARLRLDTVSGFIAKHPILSTALYVAAMGNFSLWHEFFALEHATGLKLLALAAGFFLLIVLLTSLLLQVIKFRYLLKPALVFVLLSSSLAAYFMTRYGAYMDVAMMHNILATDTREALELVTPELMLYVLLLGVVPSLVILRLKIRFRRLPAQVLMNSLTAGICTIGIVANVMMFYGDYASLFRNHHHIRYLVNPVNYLYGMTTAIGQQLYTETSEVIPVGLDAHQVKEASSRPKRTILVMVVGETARAMNFSLNGYGRQTNPMLTREDVINYPNVHSCGTSTHTSLPCMFLHFSRAQYDESEAARFEKLPDVLRHAGVDVVWRDNNSGCKGVCDNVKTELLYTQHRQPFCDADECYDEILLDHLQETIEKGEGDIVIMLHQKGSHGPAYYRRHPRQFERFSPECHSTELNDCQPQAIVNAYDNTILYTDYVLTKLIHLLRQESKQYNTAMLYMSDHGESLGENNIYLHSLPYFMAPEEQKRVPFIAWFSEGFLQERHLDRACLQQRATREYSHDNLFHSVLGLVDVRTSIYDPGLDIYRGCRIQTASGTHGQQVKG